MAITCYDVLQLPSLARLKQVGGSSGIYKEVTWVYITENTHIASSVKGGELLFITGIAFTDAEKELMELITLGAESHLAGIVVSVSPEHIREIPPKPRRLADRLGLPLFELPWDVKRIDVSREISELLLSEKNSDTNNNVLFDLLYKGLYSGRVDIGELKECINRLGLADSPAFIVIKISGIAVTPEQDSIYCAKLRTVLRLHLGAMKKIKNGYVALLPVYGEADEIISDVAGVYKGIEDGIHICISQVVGEASRLCEALRQGEMCSLIAHRLSLTSRLVYYNSISMYEIYIRQSQNAALYEYCAPVIEKLKAYDMENKGELIKTIITYFENLYNLSKTADALYLHRNSLMYRFDRIEQLTGKSLKNPYDLYELVTGCILSKLATGNELTVQNAQY